MVNAVRDDLGVGFRGEAVTQALELRAQRLVIFDDAVVNDRDPVARNVRVGVFAWWVPHAWPSGYAQCRSIH